MAIACAASGYGGAGHERLRERKAGLALVWPAAVMRLDRGWPERSFTGGLWSGSQSAIWPLARLEMFGWGICVRSSTRLLNRLIPAWDARYEDIEGAKPIAVPLANRGVYLIPVTAEPVIFWTRRGAGILHLLQMHGVPVDWSVRRIPWGVHLDHHP